MKRLITALAVASLALTMGLTPPVDAKPKLIGGVEANDRVSRLTTEMPWYRSLQQAQREAYQQKKMVFWVQMLGQLDGKT